MASILAWVSGITACGIVFTGYLTSIGLFARARREKGPLIIWEALILMCLGTFYLGTVVTFFSLITTGYNLEPNYLGAQLCYTIAPIGSAICTYTGFTMLGKEKIAKPIAIADLLTGIIYWYGLLYVPTITPDITVKANLALGEIGALYDYELKSYVMGLTAFYLVFLLLIIGGGFFWLAKQSTGDVRKRALLIAIGCCFFTVSGAVDSLIDLDFFIFVPRFFMITGAFMLYKGFLSGASEAKAKETPKVADAEALPKLSSLFRRRKPIYPKKEGGLQKPAASQALSGVPERPQVASDTPSTWAPPVEITTDISPQAGTAMQTVFEAPKALEPAQITSNPSTPTIALTKVCPSCGNTLPAAAKFCNSCGFKC